MTEKITKEENKVENIQAWSEETMQTVKGNLEAFDQIQSVTFFPEDIDRIRNFEIDKTLESDFDSLKYTQEYSYVSKQSGETKQDKIDLPLEGKISELVQAVTEFLEGPMIFDSFGNNHRSDPKLSAEDDTSRQRFIADQVRPDSLEYMALQRNRLNLNKATRPLNYIDQFLSTRDTLSDIDKTKSPQFRKVLLLFQTWPRANIVGMKEEMKVTFVQNIANHCRLFLREAQALS